MTTRRFTAALALLAVAMFAAGSTATAATVDAFVGSPTLPDTTRTDTFAQAGFGFSANPSGAKQVNQLGFWVSPDNPGGVLAVAHDVSLYNYNGANYTQIAAATVPAGSTADANGYAWANIPTVTLTDTRQGADYYIVTASVGTDVWAPNTGNANTSTLDATFGTRTNNGWFSATPAPGIGGTAGFNPRLGYDSYFGPNIGSTPLVGYWPLDGNATAVAGTDGVLVNGPTATTDRNGAAGGGMAFDGSSSQYVSIPGGGGLNGLDTATVSMWVQWNGTQDNGHGNRHGGVLGRQKNGQWSDNVLTLYNTSDPNGSNINWETRLGQGMNSGVAPGDGTWRHVAVTVSPSGEVLYVDGAPTATRGSVGGFHNDPAIPLTIGAWIGDGGSYSTSRIDDVAVWNEVLSPLQVAALAAQIATPQTVDSLPAQVRPLSVQASSELTGGHNRRAANAVDGIGQTTTNTNAWPGDTPPGIWLSGNGDTTPTITFDLGGLHDVDAMVVYNYNEATAGLMTRGVQQANVSYSTDNVTFTPGGTLSFTKAPGNASNPAQLKALGVQARYVRLDVLSNYGDGGYTGLNEVEFLATPKERMPIGGVTATASSRLKTGGFDRKELHLVDGTGLFADTHSAAPDPTMWLSESIGYAGGNDRDPEVVFDLGAVYDVQSMRIWNYNEINLLNRGVDGLEVLVSADGLTYSSARLLNLAKAPGVDTVDFSEMFYLNAEGVRYVKFDILSNHNGVSYPVPAGPTPTDNAFVGLSEVRFYEGPPIPEPCTALLAGLGMIAAGLRARRRRFSLGLLGRAGV